MITDHDFHQIRHLAATDEGLADLLDKLEVYYRLMSENTPAVEEGKTIPRPPSKSTFSRNSIYDTSVTSYRMNEKGQWIQRK